MAESTEIKLIINGQAAEGSLNVLYKKASELKKVLNQLDPNDERVAEFNRELTETQARIDNARSAMGMLKTTTSSFADTLANIGKAAFWMAILQFVYEWAKAFLDVVKNVKNVKSEISILTDATGKDLDNMTSRVLALSKTFGKDYNEVLIAANNYAKQMGISHKEAFDFIEKGFIAGADSGGDFLDKIKEYPAQFKQFGFSAETAIKLATQEVKGGIYDDKFLDTIKEIGLRLREFTKAQQDALSNAFGGEFTQKLMTDIDKGSITAEQAYVRIMTQAEKTGLSVTQLQTLTADVLGSAAEDAGGAIEVWKIYNQVINSSLETTNQEAKAKEASLEQNKQIAASLVELSNYFSGVTSKVETFIKDGLIVALQWFTKLVEVTGIFTKTNANLVSSVEDEMKVLEQLKFKLISTNQSQAERKKTIEELQKKYPEYLGNLSAEKATNEELATALDKVNASLVTKIVLKRNEQAILEQAEKTADKQEIALQKQLELETALQKFYNQNNKTRKLQEDLSGLDLLTQTNEALSAQNIGVSKYSDYLLTLNKQLEEYKNAEIALNDEKLKSVDLEKKMSDVRKAFGIVDKPVAEKTEITTKTDAGVLTDAEKAAQKARQDAAKKAREEAQKLAEQQQKDELKANEIREQLRIKNISDETERQKAELQAKALKDAQEVNSLKINESAKADLRKQIADNLAKDLQAIDDKAFADKIQATIDGNKIIDDLEKARVDKLNADKLSQANADVINAEIGKDPQAIFEAKIAQLATEREIELANLELSESKKNEIIARYTQEEIALKQSKVDAENVMRNQMLDLGESTLTDMAELFGKQTALGKQALQAAKVLNTGQVVMNSIVEISEIWKDSASIPVVGQVIGALRTAAAVARAAAAVAQLGSTKFADGGLLQGNSHANGGIRGTGRFGNFEAEGGEFFVNKQATANNLEALSMLNTYGRNMSFDLVPRIKFAMGGQLPSNIPSQALGNSFANQNIAQTNDMFMQFNEQIAGLRSDINNFETNRKTYIVYTELEDVANDVTQIRTYGG